MSVSTEPNVAPASQVGGIGTSLKAQWDALWVWVNANYTWLLLAVILIAALIFLMVWLGQRVPTKGLKRDALELMRRDMVKGARAAQSRGKRLYITGNEIFPPFTPGVILGWTRDVEGLWYATRRGMFARTEIVQCNPDDLVSGHDGREVHIRGVSLRYHRGVFVVVPDVHDPRERAIWSKAAGHALQTAGELAEYWKEWSTSLVDSLLMVDSSLVASEDLHFLRRYVTLGKDERPTETLVPIAQAPTVGSQQAGETNG